MYVLVDMEWISNQHGKTLCVEYSVLIGLI